MLRIATIVAAAVLAVAGVACNDNDSETSSTGQNSGEAQRAGGAGVPENPRLTKVTVYDDRIEPRQLTLTAGVSIQMEVANRGQKDCTFSVGSYLQQLQVPAGQTVANSFTLSATSTTAPNSSDTVTMGCEGDSSRQGKAVVEFKGVRPGPGQ